MKNFNKYVLLSISIILLSFGTSYAKKKIITVEKDLRKIQITNNKGYIIKTYYEKYSIDRSSWLRAVCKKEELKSENLFKIILNCKFTPQSLRLINDKENNNEIKEAISKSLNNNNQQKQSQEQEQEQEQEQDKEQEHEKEKEKEQEKQEKQQKVAAFSERQRPALRKTKYPQTQSQASEI